MKSIAPEPRAVPMRRKVVSVEPAPPTLLIVTLTCGHTRLLPVTGTALDKPDELFCVTCTEVVELKR